ncbi:MAG: hypothetical protein HZB68_00275 [Candidatus Aenigmarchaeota archaeon]|nr:hypothetical protein [Candidatus Aenigmarchaeota archaeon]
MSRTKNIPIIDDLNVLRGYDVEGPLASVYASEECNYQSDKPKTEVKAREKIQQKVFDDKSLENEDLVMLAKSTGWIPNTSHVYKMECDVYRKIPKRSSYDDKTGKESSCDDEELNFPIKIDLNK